MNDRIKLAEALGWTPLDLKLTGWWMPPGVTLETHDFHIERKHEDDLPDPFTDANDDYEVLVWARTAHIEDTMVWVRMSDELTTEWMDRDEYHEFHPTAYQVGDYARAALKVLDNG